MAGSITYSIFTICTENYADALDFSIPSWFKWDSVRNIYVYTDFDYTHPDERVIGLNRIKKTDDWLDVVGLKATMLYKHLLTAIAYNTVFLDADCYIKEDISGVFERDFDIAPTRMNNKKSANSGVWFFRNNGNMLRFAREWIGLQDAYKKRGRGVVKHRSSYSQQSFSDILHRELKNRTYLNVMPLDEDVYNNEADDINEWEKKAHKAKILHFKGRRWDDKDIVNKILK